MLRSLALLCACSTTVAIAGPALTDLRPLGPDDAPTALQPAPSRAASPLRPGEPIDERRAGRNAGTGIVVGRGGPLLMYDDLENLALAPTPLHGQPGNAVWSDAAITGVGRWLGTTVATRRTFAVDADVGGDASTKARLMTTTAFAPDGFFFGLRYELLRSNTPVQRMSLFPTAANPVQLEHDLYVTSLNTMWTSEPIHVTTGMIVNRILWGGTCVAGCGDIGLPTGPLSYIYVLAINPLFPGFQTLQWIDSAPVGEQVGDNVMMPTGRWVRLRHETTATGFIRHLFDWNDGTGFHLGYQDAAPTTVRIDSLGANGSYEVANSPAYYDNITARGEEWRPPEPPQPLACGPDGYADDIQWLESGPLRDQNPLWFDALSSRANVDVVTGDKFIRQTNIFSDNKYREEFTRTMPQVVATPGNPWTFCEETRVSASNLTPRGVALVSFLDNSIVTRVQLGHWDPSAPAPYYSGRVFVQHNPAYNPIDDEDTLNPFLAGPNGNGGVARIGGAATIGDPNFDYYDSGVAVPAGGTANARVLCIEVADDTSMTITYGATTIVGGGSGIVLNAFVNSLDEVRHESEKILSGTSNSFFVDDLALTCTSLPLVTLPSLTLTYLDELEWANVGVTIHANDDDGDPSTPFRWSSVGNMPVVSLAGESNVLRMQNLFADTPQTPGGFTLFPQASTQLPNVAVSPDRGYAAGASFKFTDGLTTRAWVVAEAGAAPGLYRWNTALLYSAGTGTFWALTPDAADPIQNDPAWFDTGRSLASLGISLSEWFTLTIHHNLDGTFTFKINASILTDAGGSIVRVDPLQSVGGGLHNNLDRLHFISGDDLGGANSILYADDIRAWALPCAGDTNDDGVVNFADINNILGAFNSAASVLHPANVAPDDNGDGVADDEVVNFADLNAALSRFHSTCD